MACAGILFIFQLAGCSFTSRSQAAEELFLQFWQNQREQQFAVPKPHGKRGGRDHLLLEHFSLISFILCRAFSGILKEAGTGLCCITRMSFIFRKIKSSFLARQINLLLSQSGEELHFLYLAQYGKPSPLSQIAVGHKLAVMWTSKRGS